MNTSPQRQQLLRLLCQVRTPGLMNELLEAILSDKELEEVENRLQILKQVSRNKPQREIAAELGVSIATVTRGAKVYRKSNLAPLIARLKSE